MGLALGLGRSPLAVILSGENLSGKGFLSRTRPMGGRGAGSQRNKNNPSVASRQLPLHKGASGVALTVRSPMPRTGGIHQNL